MPLSTCEWHPRVVQRSDPERRASEEWGHRRSQQGERAAFEVPIEKEVVVGQGCLGNETVGRCH